MRDHRKLIADERGLGAAGRILAITREWEREERVKPHALHVKTRGERGKEGSGRQRGGGRGGVGREGGREGERGDGGRKKRQEKTFSKPSRLMMNQFFINFGFLDDSILIPQKILYTQTPDRPPVGQLCYCRSFC